MCVIKRVIWLYPIGVKHLQDYNELCEKSVNGHFCTPLPPIVEMGLLPLPPTQPSAYGEEQQSQESAQYGEAEEEPREKRLNWVRSRRKKHGSSKKRDVYIREAELETGVIGRPIVKDIVLGGDPDMIEYRRSRPNRYWRARVLKEDVPPLAPEPPPAVPQPYPPPGFVPPLLYPPHYYPHHGGPPGALPPGPINPHGPPPPPYHGPDQVIHHQAAQLHQLQHERQNLIREREEQARRLRKDVAAAKAETDSVVAENEVLKKKLKRTTLKLGNEHRRGRSREREKDKVEFVEVTDELIEAKLSFAERKLQEDKLRRRIAESRERQEDMSRREAKREREVEDELRKQLKKERAKRRQQEEVIEDLEHERARSAERGRLRRAREHKTEAWADQQIQGLRRSNSQANRQAPPSAWVYYPQAPRRSYSVNGRPPPPPMHHLSRVPPPPPVHVKPRRSQSFDARSRSSGIGGSSTSTASRRRDRGGSSETSFKSYYSSSSSSSKDDKKDDKKKKEKKDSKKATVEDYVEDGDWDRFNDPTVFEYYRRDAAQHKEGKEKEKEKKQKGGDDKGGKWFYK